MNKQGKKGQKRGKNAELDSVMLLNESVRKVLNTPMLNYWELLEQISVINHLRCSFCKSGCLGTMQDIRKAQMILIQSIQYN